MIDDRKCFDEINLITVIVNFGMASKIMKHAKKHGVTGGTVLLGTGTIKNQLLEFLGINEARKEIVLMASDSNTSKAALEELDRRFNFRKPNHGIAFSTSIRGIFGTKAMKCNDNVERGEEVAEYNLVISIVDKGKGEMVVDAANKAGSRGATIINGRGSGIHETSKVFGMEIEPEKEVVLIISQRDLTDGIVSSISTDMKIDEPGNGIIFVQDIDSTYGLY
ncbi:P-II family nitrogen regulator [Gudongella sp. SC589]|uniref:P-II family nitrogen regulator n=1 Tax=Gudongella sp. SC589 TaxID=3385990 RepID=UPI003904BBA6